MLSITIEIKWNHIAIIAVCTILFSGAIWMQGYEYKQAAITQMNKTNHRHNYMVNATQNFVSANKWNPEATRMWRQIGYDVPDSQIIKQLP